MGRDFLWGQMNDNVLELDFWCWLNVVNVPGVTNGILYVFSYTFKKPGVPAMVQWDQWCLGSARTQVWAGTVGEGSGIARAEA